MTLEFQSELLKFLVQDKAGKKYISFLDSSIFDIAENGIAFDVIQGFFKKYNNRPSKSDILEFFAIQTKETTANIPKEAYNLIENSLKEAFNTYNGNNDFIKERITETYQLKLMKDLFADKMLDLKDGTNDVVLEIYKSAKKIKNLSNQDEEEENNKGTFALSEFRIGHRNEIEVTPTHYDSLNRLTSKGGFYSPQLIVLMGAPKAFKTGTALNVAMGLVRSGKKVYYVDCENGEERIKDRFYQAMLEATWEEYDSGRLDSTLSEMVKKFSIMGGDFRSDYYPAHTKSIADVEDNLQAIEEECGWTPDVIVYDYLDLMMAEDYKIKDKRLIIQAVYHDAIRLQKRRNIFGISLSQVNKEAVNKPVIDMTGFAEDFGKAANCHAAFALCRTEDEKEAKVMRIVPVVQRDGVSQAGGNACFVEVDEGSMRVSEIDRVEWKSRVSEVQTNKGVRPNKSRAVKSKDVKDV